MLPQDDVVTQPQSHSSRHVTPHATSRFSAPAVPKRSPLRLSPIGFQLPRESPHQFAWPPFFTLRIKSMSDNRVSRTLSLLHQLWGNVLG